MSKPRLTYATGDNWQLVNVPMGRSLVHGGRVSADVQLANGNLSICWEYTDPGCRRPSAFGQIGDELIQFAPGVKDSNGVSIGGSPIAYRLREIWREWHLNDMHAGCEHQRALGWEAEGSDHGEKYRPNPHLSEPCPECGYKFGTEWRRVELPSEVTAWLLWFRAEVEKAISGTGSR